MISVNSFTIVSMDVPMNTILNIELSILRAVLAPAQDPIAIGIAIMVPSKKSTLLLIAKIMQATRLLANIIIFDVPFASIIFKWKRPMSIEIVINAEAIPNVPMYIPKRKPAKTGRILLGFVPAVSKFCEVSNFRENTIPKQISRITVTSTISLAKERIIWLPITAPARDESINEGVNLTFTAPPLRNVTAENKPNTVIANFNVPIAVFTGTFKKVKITKTSMLPPLIIEPMKPPKKIIKTKKAQTR